MDVSIYAAGTGGKAAFTPASLTTDGVAFKADYRTITLEITENASLELIGGENIEMDEKGNFVFTMTDGSIIMSKVKK